MATCTDDTPNVDATPNVAVNELLCFMQQKGDVLAFDAIFVAIFIITMMLIMHAV